MKEKNRTDRDFSGTQEDAENYGVFGAIVLQHLRDRQPYNAPPSSITEREIKFFLPFIKVSKVKKILKKLAKAGKIEIKEGLVKMKGES